MLTFSVNQDDMTIEYRFAYIQKVIEELSKKPKQNALIIDNIGFLYTENTIKSKSGMLLGISDADLQIFKDSEGQEVQIARVVKFIKAGIENEKMTFSKRSEKEEYIDAYDEDFNESKGSSLPELSTSNDEVFDKFRGTDSYKKEVIDEYEKLYDFFLTYAGLELRAVFIRIAESYGYKGIKVDYSGDIVSEKTYVRLSNRLKALLEDPDMVNDFAMEYNLDLVETFNDVLADVSIIFEYLESKGVIKW